MTPDLSAEVVIEVPFHDVDAMGVVWHGHYLKYFEIARTAMLRKIGLDVPQLRDSGFGWFVAECHIKYIAPLAYGSRICVKATLLEYEFRVKVGYLITDQETGRRLNKAWTTHLAVDIETGNLALDLPPIFNAVPKS
jgi:acyl-CoA thioester hydrolase